MNDFIKKNITLIIGIFILLGPIIDLLTGLCVHLEINISIGIIVRIIFLVFISLITIFTFKKKKVIIPYLIIGIYFILYILGIVIYKDGIGMFQEIQGLVKVFYFPVLFISLYAIRNDIRISKMTLFTTLFLYLILIFIPLVLGIGYDTYEITKEGTLGFYNSANEISGIISLLTPVMFIILVNSKNIIPKLVLLLIYLVVILMIGTKIPLLTFVITLVLSIIYLWYISFKNKNYKVIASSGTIILLVTIIFTIIISNTNFYNNKVTEVFNNEKLFSPRLSFLHDKALDYNDASIYQKVFGIGYLKDGQETKMIEMDYFDIYYSHGIVGFLIFFIITLYILYKILDKGKQSYEQFLLHISLLLIIVLSFFTGHIITAPSVSIIAMILILSLTTRKKKDLLFTSYSMDLGGIEKALLNLVNRINLDKYNVTIILEKKQGIFLDQIKEGIEVTELKVSNNKIVPIRKIINFLRKLFYKIFNYCNYDFSCCYTTYSYSSNKLALMTSNNTAFYVHNDYRTIYKDDKDFYEFFNSRNITEYKNIIFVSNENRLGFVEKYPNLRTKCKVFNNFIDTEMIKQQSEEPIKEKKPKNHLLFIYVGRLDDDAKKISRQINLVKEIDNIDLWIIGDGPDRKKYEKEVKELKLEKRITFFGKKSNPFPYMKQADFVILTSDYEGFPVTYLEAITLHKDIITTFPTSDDSVDINKYGYVISKDQDKMVEEVKKIISKHRIEKDLDLEYGQIRRMKQLEKMFND